jgi:anti-sigma-K factor RskA
VTFYDARTGTLRLNRLSGEPPPGRSFELWLLVGKNAPVSLGVLPAEVSGSVSLPTELRKAAAEATLAVSDEPAGGSPTGQPTGDILAAAKLNSV